MPSFWYKITFTFTGRDHMQQCNTQSWIMAKHIKEFFPRCYFARYGSPAGSSTNFFVKTYELHLLNEFDTALRKLLKAYAKFGLIKIINGTAGSDAHAAMFEAVVAARTKAMPAAPTYEPMPEADFKALLYDMTHWFYNMAGLSYTDEAWGSCAAIYNAMKCLEDGMLAYVATQADGGKPKASKASKASKAKATCINKTLS